MQPDDPVVINVPLPVPQPEPAAAPEPEPQPEPVQEPVPETPAPSPDGSSLSSAIGATLRSSDPTRANAAERPCRSVDTVQEPEPGQEEIPGQAGNDNKVQERTKFRWWIPVAAVVGTAVVALAVFLILSRVAPDFIDSILYTPEELRIINY